LLVLVKNTRKLVALSVEKFYMALTERKSKICRFHGSLSQKGYRPLVWAVSTTASLDSLRSNYEFQR